MGNVLTAKQLMDDTSIASRAMKAVFHRGIGASRRTRDYEAERVVKEKFGNEGQIVTRKLFIKKDGLVQRRNQLANEMYTYHMRSTLPHGDDGSRLLPNPMYFDYTTKMGDFESKLKLMDNQILVPSSYTALIDEDISLRVEILLKQGKTTTACRDDYPSMEEMARYLYVSWHLEPVATAADFRYEVDDSVKARVDEMLREAAVEAKRDIFNRMLEPMQRFVDKLSVPIGADGSVFRDSLVENLNELTGDLPKLNFDNDPRVGELLAAVQALIKPYVFKPDALREIPETRQAARDKMAELVKRLGDYGIR